MKKETKNSLKLSNTDIVITMTKNEGYFILYLINSNEISLLKKVKEQIERQLDEG